MKMQKTAVSQALVDTCAFAVVRVPTVERGIEIAEGLAEGGVHAMEISYTLPNAGEVIAAIRERLGDKMIVGAGTVMVMYLGHQMEFATKDALFEHPLHPYTQALLDVIPRIRHERIQEKRILQGDVPSPANPPSGCVFHTRCPKAMKVCSERIPNRIEAEPGHFCACHLYDTSLSDADRTPQVAHAIEAAQKAVEEARLEEKISE